MVSLNHMVGSGAKDLDSNSNSSVCDENLISLVLSFLIYKIDIITVVRIKWDNAQKNV